MVRGGAATATEHSLVAGFDEIPYDAAAIAGGKGASLSRMAGAGLPVPPGFVVCTASFREFLESCHTGNCDGGEFIRGLTSGLDVGNPAALDRASGLLRGLILSNPVPHAIAQAIREA